jgi:hypothetical protein
MNIHLYLNNEDETHIASYHGMKSNPFKVGDVLFVNIRDLVPSQLEPFPDDHKKRILKENDELKSNFHLKNISLILEKKYIHPSVLDDGNIVVEYHCEIVNDDE